MPSSSKLAPLVLTKPDLMPDVTFMVGDVAFTKDVPLPSMSCGLAVDGRIVTNAIMIREAKCAYVLRLVIDPILRQK